MSEAEEREFIRRLARRLPAGDPLRTLVEPLQRCQRVRAEHLGAAIAEVREPRAARWRRLVVALWALDQTPVPVGQSAPLVEPLCRMVDGVAPNDMGNQGVRWCIAPAVLVGGYGTVLAAIAGVSDDSARLHDWTETAFAVAMSLSLGLAAASMGAGLLLTPFFVPVSVAVDRRRLRAARMLAARLLGQYAAPAGIGVLAQAMRCSESWLRNAAGPALRRTLDALTPESYGRVSAQDQLDLLAVARGADVELACAAVDGLGCVGGAAVLRGAGELARHGRTEAVREAAARVLPAIEGRARRERDRTILLRAAAATPEPALLRSAGSAAEDTDLLLRSMGEERDAE